ncbi:MAG: hypothetical protein A2Y34_10400 [Spirochaetes bacterium GWC1_27_15]|nr:MAG: hypothetical protein A2Z98_09640 [Spirochaetes bacterium GWB1_27_13]OHD21329.1 MAG: hypothetical protein A2Y34_10400 [Spirochaetes bacterium GWC1_27_15]
MITINGNQYKLCLFDTNALSNFLINPKDWINYFDKKFSISKTIISYSVFSLSELWFRQELFEKYINFFSIFPSVILDGYNSIFEKEISNYYKNTKINPIVIAPCAIKDSNLTPLERLKKVIENSGFILKSNDWKKNREEILNGIIDLKKNYPSKKDNYNLDEIEDFNFLATTSQIIMRKKEFAEKIIKNKKEINLKNFPSIITTSYVVFYKFYPDNRKPLLSDVFDIIISSLLPYVDIVLTEGNLCDIIKKIKLKHKFLNSLECYSLKDVKKEIVTFV